MSVRKTACVGSACVACGNCVRYCTFAAMAVYKGLCARVDESKCRGCGRCEKACPAGIITMRKEGVSA